MDGFLPPVDVGGWLEFQRKRAQQLARERVAAANQTIGAGAQATGDWIGRAGQQIDGLLPDWAQQAQEAQLSPAGDTTPSPAPSPYALQEVGQGIAGGVNDWARQANERIGGLIDQAQGIIPGAVQGAQGALDRFGAVIAQPDAPDPWGPRAPGTPSGASWLGQQLREQGSSMIDTADRDAELTGPAGMPLPGAAGLRQAAGHTLRGVGNIATQLGEQGEEIERIRREPDSAPNRGRIARAGAEGVLGALPGAFLGAGLHGTATGLGAPEPVANVVGQVGEALAPDSVVDLVVNGLVKGGWRFARPVVARAIEAIGVEATLRLLAQAPQAAFERIAQVAERYAIEMDPALREGIVNAKTYDPTGINPVQGRLAARGSPGRAPGPAMLGPVTPEEAEKLSRGRNPVGYGAEYTGPPLSSDPFPPGPGPKGEYTIPHPTGPDMVAAPPAPGTYLTSDGYKFWSRVTNGQSPYAADYERSMRELGQPKYPWDPYNSPPPAPGSPGYGQLDQSPLAEPDWDNRLGAWSPRRGTDPTTLRHLLNRYAMNERFPQEAIEDLVPSHPDLATPEAQQAALDDLNEALTRSGARRSKNEDRAIASERNVRSAPGEAVEGEPPAEGTYSYTSKKGITPDGEKGGEFHFGSSYEVASAIRFDMDPEVVSWQKGAGPRGRVRLVIDPKYGYNPNNQSLMANSDPGPGSEVIYSPDFLVTFRDGSQKVVETKNVGIYNLPAWRIEAKTQAGQRHFEDLWGVGFMMMAEDQIGRPLMRALAEGTLDPDDLTTEWLRRVRPGDLPDLQAKLRSAANASRGGGPEKEAQLLEAAQHLMDLNANSKYPPSVGLDDTRSVEQYLSASRAQAEWHNQTPEDGTTFSVDGQNIPLAPGLGGFMVGVTPVNALRNEYPTHRLDPYRLAQFRHENSAYFDLFPDARVGTHKGYNAKNEPVTYLDVAIRAPDGLSAAEAANLFRQRMVYSIDRSTNVPIANPTKQWVGKRDFTEEGAYVELQRILADGERRVAAGEPAGGEFPEYRSRGGPVARPLDLPPRARPSRAAAARGRGAVQGVPGTSTGDAEGARLLAADGDAESLPGGGLPSAGAPELPADAGGRAALVEEGSAGITAQPGDGFRGALDAALAGVQPYGYARTAGQRAFDLSGGTAGAVAGAASADEDATWQERAGRGAAGAVVGSLVGPTGRGALAQYGRKRLTDRSAREAGQLGIAGRSGGFRAPQLPGGLKWGDIPELMGALPLIAPTSQAANFTSGLARSLERVIGVAFEGRPDAAIADLAAMVRAVPGATRKVRGSFSAGPTPSNPGMTGASTAGDLLSRGTKTATAATSGVRLNAALDEFWRGINEAGATGQATYRKFDPADTAATVQRAGDFATFHGPNSQLAKKLTELKGAVRDPNAPFLDKAIGAVVTAHAPYIMMPERLLRATIGNLIPVEAAGTMIKAARRGDKRAMAEARGRMLAGLGTSASLIYAYEHGGLTGDAPENPAERRRREAQGERWNTFTVPGGARVPTRYLGALGMQMDAIATTMDRAHKAADKGADPGAVIETGINAAGRWALENSYLSDLVEFGETVKGPKGLTGAFRESVAGLPSRFTGPVTNAVSAFDPYERQSESFPEMVANRSGLRFTSPTRIDPVTGEDQRREGNPLTRYFGQRGSVQSPEAIELAGAEVSPRVIGRTEEYEGAVQSPEARRAAQRALGRQTQAAVREALAKQDYAGLPEDERKQRLQGAVRTAADRADLELDSQVTRGTKQQAQREWDAIPKFVGIDPKGDPNEIRRQNAQLQRAQTVASQYREKYGEGPWRSKMAQDEPELYKLVGRPRAPAPVLDRQKKLIEAKYKVELG
jgi:hypothetical protein